MRRGASSSCPPRPESPPPSQSRTQNHDARAVRGCVLGTCGGSCNSPSNSELLARSLPESGRLSPSCRCSLRASGASDRRQSDGKNAAALTDQAAAWRRRIGDRRRGSRAEYTIREAGPQGIPDPMEEVGERRSDCAQDHQLARVLTPPVLANLHPFDDEGIPRRHSERPDSRHTVRHAAGHRSPTTTSAMLDPGHSERAPSPPGEAALSVLPYFEMLDEEPSARRSSRRMRVFRGTCETKPAHRQGDYPGHYPGGYFRDGYQEGARGDTEPRRRYDLRCTPATYKEDGPP